MRLKRQSKLLTEPSAVSTGDIAFNLIVFFLVCASVNPDSGHPQELPKSEQKNEKKDEKANIQVALTKNVKVVDVDGKKIDTSELRPALERLLREKTKQEDKVVVVKSAKDTPFAHWKHVTFEIQEAGGYVTMQLEEESTRTLEAPGEG